MSQGRQHTTGEDDAERPQEDVHGATPSGP